jgi:DNA replication protein DnaC
MSLPLSRSEALSTVPPRKVLEALEQTIVDCETCSVKKHVKLDAGLCDKCRIKNKAISRYAESNIPVKYWNLEMNTHFKGDAVLKQKYEEVIKDIVKSYKDGVSYCFAGGHGLGKTMVCCNILKRVVEKGLSGMYVNLSDIVAVMLSRDSDDRYIARKELLTVDFLVIDEFDPRYMSNDKASDLFGKILEEIFRTRHQNGLPIFMCTNSPNVQESFVGPIKTSITSLMSTMKTVAVLGKDFRISGGK